MRTKKMRRLAPLYWTKTIHIKWYTTTKARAEVLRHGNL
jgi:hypothetical protein